jgi:ferritin-like metal-binding protein YciE
MVGDMRLQDRLVDYIEDAHAMEENVLRTLDTLIATTDDKEVGALLRSHRQETEGQLELLHGRLRAHHHASSGRKDVPMICAALLKGIADRARRDKAVKNGRDAFTIEHMEIATYEILERIADRAGDFRTAEVARSNRRQEEEMARHIAAAWDRFFALTLRDEGLTA